MSKVLGKILGTDKVIDGIVETGKTLLDQRYTKQERAEDRLRELEMYEASRNAQDEMDQEQLEMAIQFLEKERADVETSRSAARDFDIKRQGSVDFLQRNASVLIGILLIVLCFGLIGVVVLANPPIESRLSDKLVDMASYLLIAVTGYFMGSSQGSAMKNQIIENRKSRE